MSRTVSVPAFVLGACIAAIAVLTNACDDKPWDIDLEFGRRDCASDVDCADYEPPLAILYDRSCNEGYCDEGRCNVRPRTSASDEIDGDCRRTTCTKEPEGNLAS